jgi:hypothetical protein
MYNPQGMPLGAKEQWLQPTMRNDSQQPYRNRGDMEIKFFLETVRVMINLGKNAL